MAHETTVSPELSAGAPIPAKDVDSDQSVTLRSTVRIPLFVGLFVALLTVSCLGVPAMLYHLEAVWDTEFSDEVVDAMIHGSILAVFALVITYAMNRHRLRSWIAERILGRIQVDVAGHRAAGEQLQVSISGLHLERAKRIEVTRDVVQLDGLEPDERAHIARRPDHSTPKRDRSRAGPVIRAGDDDIAWSNQNTAEIDDDDPSFTPAASTTFSITEAIAENDELFQRLRVTIELPWFWFPWHARIMIWESEPRTDRSSQSTPENSRDEFVW